MTKDFQVNNYSSIWHKSYYRHISCMGLLLMETIELFIIPPRIGEYVNMLYLVFNVGN